MSDDTAPQFIVSTAPHTHSGSSVRRIMLDVIIALSPALLASFYLFGWHAVRLSVVCVLGCVGTEAICRKWMGRDLGIGDLSAVVTGLLLAMNLPPSLSSGMALVGCIIAIAIAKQVFGGIGYNPFNPALVARVALMMSFPIAMTRWHDALNPARWQGFAWTIPDAMTVATPLGLVKTALVMQQPSPIVWNGSTMVNYLVGNMGGCMGEVSALALMLGASYLLFRRCITWHIPVAYLGTVAIFAGILKIAAPETNMPVSFHMLAGGLMLGALFMATDMVTSPLTRRGQLVFGVGCGVLTMLIRRFGGYPEGVSFAILLMNAVTPLINRFTRPGIFGKSRKKT